MQETELQQEVRTSVDPTTHEIAFDHEAWRNKGADIVARGRVAEHQSKESRRAKVLTLFELGDWLISGEHLSAAYDEAVEITGFARETLYNIVSVARRFPISRRRENLEFSHYVVVAPITDESVQDELLENGSKKELSVREMRYTVETSWTRPLAKEETAKARGNRYDDGVERNPNEYPKRIGVWLNPKSAKLIRLIARAHKKQPGEVLGGWAHTYFVANREAITAEVKKLSAQLKLELQQKRAEKLESLKSGNKCIKDIDSTLQPDNSVDSQVAR